jgi:hypothetical protein
MIFLALNGAIFHEVTCTFLELDIVDCCGAARGTAGYHGIIAHDKFVNTYIVRIRRVKSC